MKVNFTELLKGFGTIFLYFFIAILGNTLFGNYYNSSNRVIANLSQLATYTLLLITMFIIYHKRFIEDAKTFKKENINIAYKNWFMGLIIMMISNLIINMFVGNIASNESLNREILIKYPISNIITMALIGPIIEEITFRLSFKKSFNNKYAFAIFTGLIFGLLHIYDALIAHNFIEILYLIPYGGLGFFFAKAFYETDNIYTSIIMHITHNSLSVFLILLMGLL